MIILAAVFVTIIETTPKSKKTKNATKTLNIKVTQSIEYVLYELIESFCLCGRNRLFGVDLIITESNKS